MRVKDIIEYVSSRKKVNATTIRAAIDYPNENRFVFYIDWKVWLKEWGLSNVRKRKPSQRYKVPLDQAFKTIVAEELVPKEFSVNTISGVIEKRFWKDASSNKNMIRDLIKKLVNQEKIYKIGYLDWYKEHFYKLKSI